MKIGSIHGQKKGENSKNHIFAALTVLNIIGVFSN